MITGELKSKVDALWNAFWSGGISNPLEVIEQITYLLFIRRLDELHTREEKKANRLGRQIESPVFQSDSEGQKLRWSRFKNLSPQEMFDVVSTKVFPFIKELRSDVEHSTYSHHMKDARFTIPTPGLLAKVVELVDDIPMEDRDTKGDVYEYMLGKIASAGQNGQFRTPRHIINMMVEVIAPKPTDIICDPACGTAGFLVSASEYLQSRHQDIRTDNKLMKHFHEKMFNGFDFDNTMLRIASMNMLLHGVENPNISYKDSLSEDHAGEEEHYTVILANPPFAGSLDYESCANDLLKIVKTKKTELLFVALFLRLLRPGGRAAVIVPDGVLFGSSNAHKSLRKMIVEQQKLDGVISLPSGVFKPYAGVSTAILIFTKTNSGGTDNVWFYEMQSDGWSLDDKRQPLLPDDKLGAKPAAPLTAAEQAKNNLPDLLTRWLQRDSSERTRLRTEQSFCVPKSDIAAQGYDLSISRYKEVIHQRIEHSPPSEILLRLTALEDEIRDGIKRLEELVR
jgi:type I restriction enzyme M protein